MMKVFFILVTFFFLIVSFGQDKVIQKNDSLQKLLRQSISDSLRVKILEELHFLWKNKSYARSIEYCKESIKFSEKHKPVKYTRGLRYQLGFVYMEAGDAVRSLEIFHQLLKELEGIDSAGCATALSFIGMNYENQGDIKRALEYQRRSSVIYEKLISENDSIDRRGYLGNPLRFGQLFIKNGQLDSALYHGQIGLNRLRYEPLNEFNRYFSWEIKKTVGDVYSLLNKYDKSIELYLAAEKEALSFNHTPDLIKIYLSLSKLKYRQKDLQTALEYGKKAYALASSLSLLPMVKESSLFLKDIYSELEVMDSALHYYDIAITMKDSMVNADNARKIDAMEFAQEKRTQELKRIEQEEAFRKKQYYLLVGILVSLLIAVFFYHKTRLKQKANQLLEYENNQIFQQRNQLQREIESFEIQALRAQLNPHFLFNCLNSIDAFIYSNNKFKATMYLNKFAKLLRNILDSTKDNTVSLQKDIQSLQLYTDLEELRNNNQFETRFNIDEAITPDLLAVPPLVVQPIVENAILHGLRNKKSGKGLLTISIQIADNKLHYHIADNGIGRSASSRIPQHKEHSYGMELARARIQMFNKEEYPSLTIEDIYENGAPAGTLVSIQLNLQAI